MGQLLMPAVYEAALAPLSSLLAGLLALPGLELNGSWLSAATERSWLAMPRYTAGLTGRAGTGTASNKKSSSPYIEYDHR